MTLLSIKPRYAPPTADPDETWEIRQRELDARGLLCHDCGADTIALGEYYMVADEIWEAAWSNYQRKPRDERLPGDEVLCLVCLQKRLNRPVELSDFTAVVPSLRGLERAREAWKTRWRSATRPSTAPRKAGMLSQWDAKRADWFAYVRGVKLTAGDIE
jgi:hypothetical protein